MAAAGNRTDRTVIPASAQQHAGWWTATADDGDLPPVTAKSLSAASSQLSKIAADVRGVPPESLAVRIETELPPKVAQLVDQADEHRRTAAEATEKAKAATNEAILLLHQEKWPTRDISTRLRVASKTVSDLASGRRAQQAAESSEPSEAPQDDPES